MADENLPPVGFQIQINVAADGVLYVGTRVKSTYKFRPDSRHFKAKACADRVLALLNSLGLPAPSTAESLLEQQEITPEQALHALISLSTSWLPWTPGQQLPDWFEYDSLVDVKCISTDGVIQTHTGPPPAIT